MKTSHIVILVVGLAAVGGGAYLLLRKPKSGSTGAAVPPPLAIPKQTNLISQVGSFLGSTAGQNIVDKVEHWLD